MSEKRETSAPSSLPKIKKNYSPQGHSRHKDFLTPLGVHIKSIRKGKKLSRQALAEKAQLSHRFIAHLEGGQGNISVGNLSSLAFALGVPLSVLVTPSSEETKSIHIEIAQMLVSAPLKKLEKFHTFLRENQAMPHHDLIVLMGLRGAGKSTIGPLLGQRLGYNFLELDDVVQDMTGLEMGEMFEMHGESYYREMERTALESLTERGEPLVISVSGGIVNDAISFRILKEQTLLIWLQAKPYQHMERVISQGDKRPMRNRPNAMAELNKILVSRRALYSQAHLSLDTSEKTPEECTEILFNRLQKEEG